MRENRELLEQTWVLLQHKSRHYIGIITHLGRIYIKILCLDDEKTFKRKDVTTIKYKPNIRIIPITEVLKNYPKVNGRLTEIIETIKKQENYDLILTSKLKFTKKNGIEKFNKIQKTTLWKKFYNWTERVEKRLKVAPILFFKHKGLEFMVLATKLGQIKFVNKDFEEIKKFSNKKLNVLLKKTQKNNKEELKKEHDLSSAFDCLEIDESFIESVKRNY